MKTSDSFCHSQLVFFPVPYGCLYSVNQQAVNIVFQRQSTSGGTAFKQQSQLFDTSPPHLSAQPSPDVKAHLPIKHNHKTLIRPLFPLYGFSSHNYPWSRNQHLVLWLSFCGRKRKGGAKAPNLGCCRRHEWAKRSTFMYRQASSHRLGSWADRCTLTHTQEPRSPPPPLHPLSLCSISLLALSCFPDSRWRPDRRAEWVEVRPSDDRPRPLSVTSTLPACCLKINWQSETQNLTHCLFTYIFFLPALTPHLLAEVARWGLM